LSAVQQVLAEVTALTARARLFIGNDSGIAHIAAATGTPCVVIFGSSNVTHWRPWTAGPSEVVREELACQPCHGYFCAEFDQPQCILRVPVERVVRFGEPAEEIRLEAEAFNADLVALATSRRNRLAAMLRPGVVDRVIQEAPVPTLILRD